MLIYWLKMVEFLTWINSFIFLNNEALFAIKRAMKRRPDLKVTLPNIVEDTVLKDLF